MEIRIDPYENYLLIYDLRNGKHLSVYSRKQVNNTNKLPKMFNKLPKIEKDILFMNKKNKWYVLPTKPERISIIDKMHAASENFVIDSTGNRIREKYSWPKLHEDVENFKNNSNTCIRNDDYQIRNHPAFVKKTENEGNEVSIDFCWGLDETKNGFKGVMILIETVTQHVEIYKMKKNK